MLPAYAITVEQAGPARGNQGTTGSLLFSFQLKQIKDLVDGGVDALRVSGNHIEESVIVTCPPKRSPVLMLDWNLRKGEIMVRKTYLPEQIINKLREAAVMLSQGATIAVITRKIGVSDHTYYR